MSGGSAVTDVGEPTERPLVFGRNRGLVGMWTEPLGDPPGPDRPTVVLLNAGIIHKVGPNRLYVRLARALARQGVGCLRFDLSGLGDSARPAEDAGVPRREVVGRDIRDALDTLESDGRGCFVLLGLCSGADNAFLTVGRDPRVRGVVLLDPHAFRTVGYWVHHYGRRLLRLESWMNVLKGRSPVMRAAAARLRRGREAPEPRASLGAVQHDPRDVVRKRLEGIVEQGVRLLYVFTGGLEARYNHKNQFVRAFPGLDFGDRLTLEYLADSDHTFSREEDKRWLEERVLSWIASDAFTPAPPGTTPADTDTGREPAIA